MIFVDVFILSLLRTTMCLLVVSSGEECNVVELGRSTRGSKPKVRFFFLHWVIDTPMFIVLYFFILCTCVNLPCRYSVFTKTAKPECRVEWVCGGKRATGRDQGEGMGRRGVWRVYWPLLTLWTRRHHQALERQRWIRKAGYLPKWRLNPVV